MVIFLQRTFTSLVHAHAGRTQVNSIGQFTRCLSFDFAALNFTTSQTARELPLIEALAVNVTSMNEPYRSILDQEFDDLYQYVSSVERSLWGVSETGRTAAQLAYHTGSGISTAIIVGAHPEAISEIDWSYEQLIEELIREYSELSLCSGWNDGIEYELWAVLNSEYRMVSPVRMS